MLIVRIVLVGKCGVFAGSWRAALAQASGSACVLKRVSKGCGVIEVEL